MTAPSLQPRKNSKSSFLRMAGALGVISLVVTSLIALSLSIRDNQDLRQQASVDDGIVKVSLDSNHTTFRVGETAEIPIFVDTQSSQTNGLQLEFTFKSDNFSEPDLSIVEGSGLDLSVKNIEPINGGYLVRAAFLPEELTQPFSTQQPRLFAKITTTPNQLGSAQIIFNQERSLSALYKSDPPKDELALIQDLTLTSVLPGTGGTSSPSPRVSPSPSLEPGCYYQEIQCFTTPCNPILICDDVEVSPSPNTQVFCTEDARTCPDGSGVGRDPNNNCEFFACPGETASPSPSPSASPDDGRGGNPNTGILLPRGLSQFNVGTTVTFTDENGTDLTLNPADSSFDTILTGRVFGRVSFTLPFPIEINEQTGEITTLGNSGTTEGIKYVPLVLAASTNQAWTDFEARDLSQRLDISLTKTGPNTVELKPANLPYFDKGYFYVAAIGIKDEANYSGPFHYWAIPRGFRPISPSGLEADLNNDGKVNILDYSLLAGEFNKDPVQFSADLNFDQKVNILDYSLLVQGFKLSN